VKSRALGAGIDLCGVHFLTPGELRERLAQHLGLPFRVPLREHLRLLLSTAAERVTERAGESTAIGAAAPDQLLKAIDAIGGSGWSFAEAGPPRLRSTVAEFQQLLAQAGFSMVHEADRALLAAATSAPPHFSQLLVTGFNALHWPSWPLLEAAVRLADSATVCLTDPRPEGEDLDAAWVGTWEETFGSAEPVAADADAPMADLWRLPETAEDRLQRESTPAEEVIFLIGRDTAGQARAIVAQVIQFLADPDCQRLGVLFPSAGALSRRVAALLAEQAVPHQDGLAHHAPGPLENPAWPAWLALQESPRLPALIAFIQTRPEYGFADLPVGKAASELQQVYQELLLDDLPTIASYLGRYSKFEHAPALAAALEALPFLPARSSLASMIERTEKMFNDLGWHLHADELRRVSSVWRTAPDLEVSRRSWLRWLGETLDSWRTERAATGAHPYSRLHLLPYAHAESQAWTHLIVTGLNEGQWPPALEDSGFLDEEEIDALNRSLRGLNTRAATQGSQGEGHITVQAGKAFCLGPAQRRTLAARQFLNTLESTTQAVAVTAQLHDEAAPDRPFNPSEFFTRLHFCARGRAVEQATMTALHRETLHWLETCGLWVASPGDAEAGQSTLRAHAARRAVDQPFGEYEFALRTLPRPLRLAARRWEDALTSPAEVWMGSVLGVFPEDIDENTPWALAQGNWVHDWLRALANGAPAQTFVPLPSPAEARNRVRTSALAFRERVTTTLSMRGRTPPDWWLSAWEQALGFAVPLAERAVVAPGRTHAAVEWKFEEIAIPIKRSTLLVRGRIDLLLTNGESIEDAWLIDYKTGHRRPLKARDLVAGDGVQLALYALALRAAGARTVGVSLLTADGALDVPQLTLEDLDPLTGLWRGLVRMQNSGVFGLRGALRSEFGVQRSFPLAMLAIDEAILVEKWTRTHRHFAGVVDDEEEG
jgi:hypothetical protein